MSSDLSSSLLLRSSALLTGGGLFAYALIVFLKSRLFKLSDALNVALVFDAIYCSGKMLYRCVLDESFHPGEELFLYLVIGALAILGLSWQALCDQYKRL
jgi:hypothetical protein